MLLIIAAAGMSAAQTRLAGGDQFSFQRQIQTAKQAWDANRLDEAALGFQAVLRHLPDFAEGHMNLGMIRHAQFRYTEAIPELEQALRLNPALNDARGVLGLDYFQTGVLPKAMEQLEKAVKKDPTNPEFNGWLGMVYVGAGLFRPAIAKLEVAVQAKPRSVLFLGYLARAYAGITAQVHQQLAELAKDSPQAHLALAQAYAASGNREEGTEEYQAAAAMAPKLAGVNGALGDLYTELGKFSDAEGAYRKELEISPDFPANQFRIGKVLAELGRADEALPHLQKAVQLDPTNGEALFYLGKVYFDLERFTDAKEALHKALDYPLIPKRLIAVHYELWMAYRRLGDSDEAGKQLHIFNDLEAKEQAAKKARQ